MQAFLRIHPDDKVAVALEPLSAHSEISMDGEEIVLLEDIPQGHKFALCDIGEGEEVIKYGAPVGIAKSEIRRVSWVHTHNMKTGWEACLPTHMNRRLAECRLRRLGQVRKIPGNHRQGIVSGDSEDPTEKWESAMRYGSFLRWGVSTMWPPRSKRERRLA